MFFDLDLKGNRLPPGTLCLTYDDGPDEQTEELGRFLAEEGVPATFFFMGAHVERRPRLVERLREWGHLVGNHTFSHPGLVALAARGGDVVGELVRTHQVIANEPGDVVYFRAPYGNWREKIAPDSEEDRPVSCVAEILNGSGRFPQYVGPVNWDIVAEDWAFWERGAGAVECASAYFAEVERNGQGIVLMHDSSENEPTRRNNRTMEATKQLVPRLKERGYRFNRLDEVPQVASAARVSDQVGLKAANGRFVSLSRDDDGLFVEATSLGGWESLGIVDLGKNRLALRAANGLYLTAPDVGGPVRASSPSIGQAETFHWVDRDGRHCFRTVSGLSLAPERDEGGPLIARSDGGDPYRFQTERRFAGSRSIL